MHVKPVRYQDQGCLHFITFSCYRRMRLLDSPAAKQTFERTLERVRVWYGCYIVGYVVMPEHVPLLISEPERAKLSVAYRCSSRSRHKSCARSSWSAHPPAKSAGRVGQPGLRLMKVWGQYPTADSSCLASLARRNDIGWELGGGDGSHRSFVAQHDNALIARTASSARRSRRG
jgi:REP element-mobilizing transposase RayT